MFDNCLTIGYPEDMASIKRIKTRELLRNFKSLKAMLTSGRVQHIVIDIGDNRELELSVKGPSNTGENLARLLRAMPKTISIKRTRIFDDLFQRNGRHSS